MRVALLMWPDTFEDWYDPLGIDRETFLTDYDGEWVVSAARALGARAEVHLIYTSLGPAAVQRQKPSGADVHFVPVSPLYRGLRTAVWGHRYWNAASRLWPLAPVASTFSFRLLRELSLVRPDIVVVQDYETVRFAVVAPLLRLAGWPVVALDTGASARPSRWPGRRHLLQLARTVLASHEQEAERVRATGHPRVAVWPVPLRTDPHVSTGRKAARRALGIAADNRVVVSAGRLHAVKGLHELADACAGLDCDVVLVGSGPEREALERRAGPRLRMTGWCRPEDVARWYAAADVVVLASRQEGQPRAILEAMACGRAVVATAVGGVPDVVRPGRTGWLVPPRDVPALRAAVSEALADRERADALGAAGRRYVIKHHDFETAGERLLELLEL